MNKYASCKYESVARDNILQIEIPTFLQVSNVVFLSGISRYRDVF
jgi:hypothetical protein